MQPRGAPLPSEKHVRCADYVYRRLTYVRKITGLTEGCLNTLCLSVSERCVVCGGVVFN